MENSFEPRESFVNKNEESYLSEKMIIGSKFEIVWPYQMVVDTPEMLNGLKTCYYFHAFLVVWLLLNIIREAEEH